MIRFTVQIANNSRRFVMYLTNAPKAYDGFGTITILETGTSKQRLVIIDVEHETWQTGRYASGLHAYTPAPDWMLQNVEEELLKRLGGADE